MNPKHEEKESSEDLAMIAQISKHLEAPSMSPQEARSFDAKLYSKLNAPSAFQVRGWAFAMAASFLLIGLGWNLIRTQPMTKPVESVLAEDSTAELEWVAALVGIESETESLDDLPEEYATMMLMMDESSEEWSE